ncbi:homoserine O-acetyltransferase [uncultured Jatrophihabitans sp.]|uniref:homoserine O-acetyltransferase MetX n=1 Tax=uncultured Jatrophihabitans sp. TaxID=1610747 RepID=UPI0035C9509C
MAGWRVGDPVAGRRFADLGAVELELGGHLPAVRVAYETWGRPRLDEHGITNAVLVEHALTGDAHVAGPAGKGQPTPGWWDALVGPGRALDTNRWFVVAANVLGGCQGTTGPSSADGPEGRPWGSRFPALTIRDQVDVEVRLADHLGVPRFAAVLGGSMGGMRALEWAAGHPGRVSAALVLAVGAAASADQLATQYTQVSAIRSDPAWVGGDYLWRGPFDTDGPRDGLGTARRIAHLTYRSELELDTRFGREVQDDGRYAVVSYLDHHADKLADRFDAGSYVTLTEAMDTHDVGRGRVGVEAALAAIRVPLVVAGVDSDRLYPLRQQQFVADHTPTADGLHVIASDFGHDGFLLETEQVGRLIQRTLDHAVATTPSSADDASRGFSGRTWTV